MALNWHAKDCISHNGGGKSVELVQLADKIKEIIINVDSSKMLLTYGNKVKNVVDSVKEFFCISLRLHSPSTSSSIIIKPKAGLMQGKIQ